MAYGTCKRNPNVTGVESRMDKMKALLVENFGGEWKVEMCEMLDNFHITGNVKGMKPWSFYVEQHCSPPDLPNLFKNCKYALMVRKTEPTANRIAAWEEALKTASS